MSGEVPAGPVAGVGYGRVEVLAGQARELSGQIAVLQARLASIAAEIETEPAGFLGGVTPRWWLGFEAGLTAGEARQSAVAAEASVSCPKVFEQFAVGRISLGTMVRLAPVASVGNQDAICDTIEHATPSQLEIFARDAARVIAADRPAPTDRLSWGYGRDGRWKIHGDLAPELGALAESALSVTRATLIRELAPAPDETAGLDCTDPTGVDVFTRAAETVLAAGAVDGRVPEAHQIVVHCDLDAFLAAHGVPTEAPVAAWIQGGGAVDPAFVGSILATSSIRYLLTTHRADPVFLTKASRVATPNQLRALWARDRCCQFGDCGSTRRLRAHHLTFWSHGGQTRLDNLVLICPKHHRRIHVEGWSLTRDPATGEVTTAPPHAPGRHRRRWHPPPPPQPPPVPARPPHHQGDHATHWARDIILTHWLPAA